MRGLVVLEFGPGAALCSGKNVRTKWARENVTFQCSVNSLHICMIYRVSQKNGTCINNYAFDEFFYSQCNYYSHYMPLGFHILAKQDKRSVIQSI